MGIKAGKTGRQDITCTIYNGNTIIGSQYITVNVQNPYNGGGGNGDNPCGGNFIPNVIYPPKMMMIAMRVLDVNNTSERVYFRKIVIYNIQGQKVLEANNSKNLDISHLILEFILLKEN